jgi:MYXO-CTERM domain-containing protein
MKQLVVLAALLATVGIAREVRAGACAPQTWTPVIISPAGKPLPSDGALLVGAKSTAGDPVGGAGANPVVAKWTLGKGKKAVPLKAEAVAPGLGRYTWDKAAPGKHKVFDAKGKEIGEIEIGATKAKPLGAPKVEGVYSYSQTFTVKHGPRPGSRTAQYVTVRLESAAPADAVGLVLFIGEGDKARGGLFTRVGSTMTDVQMFRAGGRCQPYLRGQVRPNGGQKVSLAWVGRDGSLSPRSAVVTVSDSAPGPRTKKTLANKAITRTQATGDDKSAKRPPEPNKKKSKKGCAVGGDQSPLTFGLLMLVGLACVRRRKG